MPGPQLYLASSSPRRRQLLREAGIPYTLHVVPVDEDAMTAAYSGPMDKLGEYLACLKAIAAAESLLHRGTSAALILASDTTVLIDGQSLSKPRDVNEATHMLRSLRGREHLVATGVALAGLNPGDVRSATSATRVRMRDFSDGELATYVATGDPLDKAGAYSIQHPAFSPVAAITGCHLGVIGLPVCLVSALLRGAPLPPDRPTCNGVCPWSARCTPPFPVPDDVSEVRSDACQRD